MRFLGRLVQRWGEKKYSRLLDRYGQDSVSEALKVVDGVEEGNFYGFSLKRGLASWFWGWVFTVILFSIFLSYLFGWQGIFASILLSVSLFFVAISIRSFLVDVHIHPGYINGYNFSQRYLKKYSMGGPVSHKVLRSMLMRRWYYFLYSKSGKRWSYRPYLLLVVYILVSFLWPVIGASLLFLFLSVVVFVINRLRIPTALYMGGSNKESHAFFHRLRVESGARWVSLLKDNWSIDEPRGSFSDYASALREINTTNPWSLRLDEDDDWVRVVNDFIYASSIIVIRAEDVGAVRHELLLLSMAENLNRVFVVRTPGVEDYMIPDELFRCITDEKELFRVMSSISTDPKGFSKYMSDRQRAQ